MKIIVLVKSVPDTASLLRIAAGGRRIITDELEFIVNPYDEFALEEGVRLKEAVGGEVIAVGLGGQQTAKGLRHALAAGADLAIWIKTEEAAAPTPGEVAELLAAVLREQKPDVIFAGKVAIDDQAAQVPERIAVLLDIAHVPAITGFAVHGDQVEAVSQVEDGSVTVTVALPAVFTTEKGLNTPRYPKLPEILRAKRKALIEVDPVTANQPAASASAGDGATLTLQSQQRSATILTGSPIEQAGRLVPRLAADGLLQAGREP
jgi:electron transfer flavoprotein beta subunit